MVLGNYMITYNDIYEVSRKERYSEQLQKLPKNFIKDVSQYFQEKKEITNRDDDMFSDSVMKSKKQLENAITLFKELMLRRRKKILNLVLVAAETGISKQDFESMLDFEKTLFDKIMDCINFSDKELNCSLNGSSKGKERKNILIMFLESISTFTDMDGEKLGPYEEGQIANIPIKIAELLIEDGKAEEVRK